MPSTQLASPFRRPTRRQALLGGTSIAAVGLVAGCAQLQNLFKGMTPDAIAAEVGNDLNAVDTGLLGFLPALKAAVPSIPDTVYTQATTAVQTLQANSADLAKQLAAGISVHGVVDGLRVLVSTATLLAGPATGILTPFFPAAPLIGAVATAALAALEGALAAATGSAAATTGMSTAAAVRLLQSKPLLAN